MSKERWQSKVALVTGASSGIGRAIATRLAAAGLHVVLAARRRARLEALHSELQAASLESTCVELDVRDEASVQACMAAVRRQAGGLHVLVNNAGLGYGESLLEGSTERFREMLEVNVLGLCVVTREGIALMREHGQEGHVFNLGSLSGHRIPPGSNLYGATKFAVRSLTESLRRELLEAALPIRVTSISPGYVETEFHKRYYGSQRKSEQLYSSYKVLEPNDVADALLYALHTPAHVQVHDLLLRPSAQPT